MSREGSEELLFGNITDADGSQNNSDNGTDYPQHLTTVAIDSSDDESYNNKDKTNSHSPIQIKRKKSKPKPKMRKKLSAKSIADATNDDNNNNNNLIESDTVSHTNNDAYEDDELVNIDINNIKSKSKSKSKSKKKKNKKRTKTVNGTIYQSNNMIDNDESDMDTDDDDDNDNINNNNKDISSTNTISQFFSIIKSQGYIYSFILTIIVIITLLSCISAHIAAIIIFIVFYLIYLIECYLCDVWKQFDTQQSPDASVKLLDTLRKSSPQIRWKVESYHYETKLVQPTGKKVIVWVHGKPEFGGRKFEDIGYDVQYFKWDWNATKYVSNKNNQLLICAIILPSGYAGDKIKKQMINKYSNYKHESVDGDGDGDGDHDQTTIPIHNDDEKDLSDDDNDDDNTNKSIRFRIKNQKNDSNLPYFVRWNGDIDALIQKCISSSVISQEKTKIITHSNEMIYPYDSWKDISGNYPPFNTFITKLTVNKIYCLSNDETRQHYNELKDNFLSENNKDIKQSFIETMNILGYKNFISIKKQKRNGNVEKNPMWMTKRGYWIWSIFFCTLYPRYKVATMCNQAKWEIVKSISI